MFAGVTASQSWRSFSTHRVCSTEYVRVLACGRLIIALLGMNLLDVCKEIADGYESIVT